MKFVITTLLLGYLLYYFFIKIDDYLISRQKLDLISIINSNKTLLTNWADKEIFYRKFNREEIVFSGSSIIGFRVPESTVAWPDFIKYPRKQRSIKILGVDHAQKDFVALFRNTRFGIVIARSGMSKSSLPDQNMIYVSELFYIFVRKSGLH